MRFHFYIAKRYLFSKKSRNLINVISAVSVCGICISSMALIIILSVFNGFENLITSLYSNFNPDIRITNKMGRNFPINSVDTTLLYQNIPEISHIVATLEETVLLKNQSLQHIATIKGVSNRYLHTPSAERITIEGTPTLHQNGIDFAIFGLGIAHLLNIDLYDPGSAVTIYAPQTPKGLLTNPFKTRKITPSGIFSIQQEIDTKYIIAPLTFTQNLTEQKEIVSSIDIYTHNSDQNAKTKEAIIAIIGDDYLVKDQYEQESLLYKMMKSEKMAIYVILSFILLIATFNIIGAISIIIAEKKSEINTLSALGLSSRNIKKIFFLVGLLINLIGAISGLFLGYIICIIQQHFGIIKLDAQASFIINSYPVAVSAIDFLAVFLIVNTMGILLTYALITKVFKDKKKAQ